MAINFVSTMLGHTNLTTTSRYLNIHRRGLHLAMQKYEEARRPANSCKGYQSSDDEPASDRPSARSDNPLISRILN
jgi:hypothetical protein